MNQNWSQDFIEFLNFLLQKDPKKRATANQLLNGDHAFLAKAKDNVYLKEHLIKSMPQLKGDGKMQIEGQKFLQSLSQDAEKKKQINWNFKGTTFEQKVTEQ